VFGNNGFLLAPINNKPAVRKKSRCRAYALVMTNRSPRPPEIKRNRYRRFVEFSGRPTNHRHIASKYPKVLPARPSGHSFPATPFHINKRARPARQISTVRDTVGHRQFRSSKLTNAPDSTMVACKMFLAVAIVSIAFVQVSGVSLVRDIRTRSPLFTVFRFRSTVNRWRTRTGRLRSKQP